MFSPTQDRLPKDAISQIYRTCYPVLLAKCQRMFSCAADAEDIAQEVFLRLLKSDLFRGREQPSHQTVLAWVYRTSTRAAIDRLRQQRVRSRYHAEPRGEPASTLEPSLPAAQGEDWLAARRAIEQLSRTVPHDELEAVILHRLDSLTQPEIAAVIGTSERTVRRMLARFDERVAALAPKASEELSV